MFKMKRPTKTGCGRAVKVGGEGWHQSEQLGVASNNRGCHSQATTCSWGEVCHRMGTRAPQPRQATDSKGQPMVS